jgi:hypothetical protein
MVILSLFPQQQIHLVKKKILGWHFLARLNNPGTTMFGSPCHSLLWTDAVMLIIIECYPRFVSEGICKHFFVTTRRAVENDTFWSAGKRRRGNENIKGAGK